MSKKANDTSASALLPELSTALSNGSERFADLSDDELAEITTLGDAAKAEKDAREDARRRTLEEQRHREIDEAWLASLSPEARNRTLEIRPAKGLYRLPTSALEVEATRFRYRRGGNPITGVDRLEGVQGFDDSFADIATVWFSPDGRFYVVDGHQRVGLAKRLGIPDLRVQVLDHGNSFTDAAAHNVDEINARAFGALKDLHKNTFSIDLAKLAEDLSATDEELLSIVGKQSRQVLARAARLLELSRLLLLRAEEGHFPWWQSDNEEPPEIFSELGDTELTRIKDLGRNADELLQARFEARRRDSD
jgi:hypothetical protein